MNRLIRVYLGIGAMLWLAPALPAQTVVGPVIFFDSGGECPTGSYEPIFGCHPHPQACGPERVFALEADRELSDGTIETIEAGIVSSVNDKDYLFFSLQPGFGPFPPIVLLEAYVHFGEVPWSETGPAYWDFDYQVFPTRSRQSLQFAVDRSGIPDSSCQAITIAIRFQARRCFLGSCTVLFDGFAWMVEVPEERTEVSVCASRCPFDCAIAPGEYRTQTQGGWGSPAHGDNPGAYRDQHFADAFPTGLTVGCGDGQVVLTSAAATENLLPTGGPPRILRQVWVDPSKRDVRSGLVGKTVALAMSAGLDRADPDFGLSLDPLGSLQVASGDFVGMTVDEVLETADRVLGGCDTETDPGSLNQLLTQINENFVDGQVAGTALVCPAD